MCVSVYIISFSMLDLRDSAKINNAPFMEFTFNLKCYR